MLINKQFSSVNTKVSAMKSKTLMDKDYINIMQLSSMEDVLDYLIDNTVYQDVLWDLRGKEVNRNIIENRLFRYRETLIEKLMIYVDDKYKDLFKKFLLLYEIEDLKLIFKAIRGRINPQYIDTYLFSNSKYATIDFPRLLEQNTLTGILNSLKDTIYYRLIEPYYKELDDKFNFYLEMALDKFYYHELMESIHKFPYSIINKYEEIFRNKIDLYNLEWIYRATKYFELSKDEILNFALDNGFKYDINRLQKILRTFDPKNPQKSIKGSQYEFLFSPEYNMDLFMERRINRYIYYQTQKLYRSSILSFGKTISFIELIEFEIKDIFTIIESKRYQMPANEVSKYLIRTIEVK
ncbi:MAG TPA: V-type ATPase subunit [Eubacteriaceae bacterium]|nr:V-type ATPase subunit [Eubacteriaceae bacterium]